MKRSFTKTGRLRVRYPRGSGERVATTCVVPGDRPEASAGGGGGVSGTLGGALRRAWGLPGSRCAGGLPTVQGFELSHREKEDTSERRPGEEHVTRDHS